MSVDKTAAKRRRRGAWLVAGGVAQLAAYTGLVWFGIFGHDGGAPVCFGPHRDVFFPPATVCTPAGAPAYRATSLLASGAGAVLFVIGASLLVAGLLALLRSRPRTLERRLRAAVTAVAAAPAAMAEGTPLVTPAPAGAAPAPDALEAEALEEGALEPGAPEAEAPDEGTL